MASGHEGRHNDRTPRLQKAAGALPRELGRPHTTPPRRHKNRAGSLAAELAPVIP